MRRLYYWAVSFNTLGFNLPYQLKGEHFLYDDIHKYFCSGKLKKDVGTDPSHLRRRRAFFLLCMIYLRVDDGSMDRVSALVYVLNQSFFCWARLLSAGRCLKSAAWEWKIHQVVLESNKQLNPEWDLYWKGDEEINVSPIHSYLSLSFSACSLACLQVRQGAHAIFGPSDPQLGAHVQSICDALEIPHLEVGHTWTCFLSALTTLCVIVWEEYTALSEGASNTSPNPNILFRLVLTWTVSISRTQLMSTHQLTWSTRRSWMSCTFSTGPKWPSFTRRIKVHFAVPCQHNGFAERHVSRIIQCGIVWKAD